MQNQLRKLFFPYHRLSLFYSLLVMTLLLGVYQVGYHFSTLAGSGMMNTVIANTLSLRLLFASSVFFPLLSYIVIQFCIYLGLIAGIWYAAHALGRLFYLRPRKVYWLGLLLWVLTVIWIYSANTLNFHHSDFAIQNVAWYPTLARIQALGILFFALLLFMLMVHFVHLLVRRRVKHADIIFLLCLICLLGWHEAAGFMTTRNKTVAATSRPNIILISVEALRPEFVFQSYRYEQTMPFLANMLQSSFQFTDAYTPIAQSFPAWISVITAKAPMHNGARSLYTSYQKIDFHDSLIEKLKSAGYQTFYAVDGQRFGDITEAAGFDHVLSPPYGAAELIIGFLSDFPLSNLISLTDEGKTLFPWYFANRSISVTYHPDDFISLIRKGLAQRNGKPLFFAIHFGLSHWPYVWADDKLAKETSLPEKYQYSLHAVDQQIQDFIILLQEESLLDHAIVVLISDHGIGLGLPHDRIITENNYVGDKHLLRDWIRLPYSVPYAKRHKGIDTSYGYSTDILSLTQYQVLLAFKTLGFNLAMPKNSQARASLMDIAPTLLAMLNLPAIKHADGVSLLDDITHDDVKKSDQRTLYFENGFTTPEIAQADISMNGVLKAAINAVSIDDQSGLLFITDQAGKLLLKNKQRAMLQGEWLLAWYPDKSALVLVNTASKKWTMDFNSDLARQAPIHALLEQFLAYNQSEVSIAH